MFFLKPTPFNFEPLLTKIHGLTEVDCLNAPEFKYLWPSVSSWFHNQVILGHNVSFEKSVLKHLSLEYQIDFNVMVFVYTKYFKKIITGIRKS